ncbi:MAG: N-acetyltransferase [Candidatus Coatesbacteria bacterium]|nr:N-acetyltransferase [Candidatus Coatesbacteria bacterium]
MVPEGYFVHETSVIDPGAEIGEGTQIWHFSHVMGGAKIGKGCKLGQNVFVAKGAVLGQNCKIQNNVSIYEGVVLEDDVFCGPSMVFTNIKTPRSAFVRNTTDDYLKTLVKTGASIGANATVVCGVTIGRHAFVGAGSVVSRDVPDYALVYGVPAVMKGFCCECGVRLSFSDAHEADCFECHRKFTIKGMTVRRT